MVFAINFVRNLNYPNETSLKTALETLRKHFQKTKISHKFFVVKEIGHINHIKHIHACLIFKNVEDMIQMETYIMTHHLKAYVDKHTIIPTENQVKFYVNYMCKDLTKESKRYEDFNYCTDIDYWKALIYPKSRFIFPQTFNDNSVMPEMEDLFLD